MECSITHCSRFYTPNIRVYFYIALYARQHQNEGSEKPVLWGSFSQHYSEGGTLGSEVLGGLN